MRRPATRARATSQVKDAMSEPVSHPDSADDSVDPSRRRLPELQRELELRTRELTFLQERYRLLLESITDYVYSVQLADGCVVATQHGPGCIAVTGYSAQEFADDPTLWIQMVHPADQGLVTAQSKKLLTGDAVSAIEHRILHKNGNHRWVNNSTIPKYDFDGKLLGYDGIIRDITDRKRTELAVQEKREHQQRAGQFLTNILSNTFMAAVYLDTAFNYLWVNEAYAKSCARPASFFPGKNLFALYPQLTARSLFIKAAAAAEPLFGTALAIAFPDQPERGITYWDYSLYPIADSTQTMIGLVLTMAEVTARIRIEEQMRASETRYRTVANYTYDWECWETPDGNLAYCSPACLRVTGHPPEEHLSHPALLESIVLHEDLRLWQAHRRELGRSRDSRELDFRIRKPDGQIAWLSQRCASVVGEDGTHLGWRASTRDITDRKKIEIQLRTQAELLNLSPVGVTVYDEAGRFSYANQAALDLHGYTRDEFFALRLDDLCMEEDLPRVTARERQLRDEGHFSSVVQHRRKDGSSITLWTDAKAQQLDGRLTVLSTSMDITERERDANALAEGACALSALFDAINQAVYLIDCDGTVVTCNGVAASRFGKTVRELEGTSLYASITGEVAVRHQQAVIRVSQTAERHRFDDLSDGRFLQHTIYPIKDQSGQVGRMAIFVEDTSEQHLADERLRKTNEQLLRLREAQARFMTDGDPAPVYATLLQAFVTLTDSRFGILDTIESLEAPISDLCPLATVHLDSEVDEYHLCQQVARCLRQQAPMVSNRDAPPVSRRTEASHAPSTDESLVRTSTTIPLLYGGHVVGVVGLANRTTAYDTGLIESLAPFTASFAATLHAVDTLRRYREQGLLLRDSEEANRALGQTVPGVVCRLSIFPQWRLLHVNAGAVAATGYAAEALLDPGFDWTRLFFEEDLSHIVELVNQAMTTRQPREMDLRLRTASGEVRWFHTKGQVVRDSSSQTTYLDSVAIDISARKTAESALATKTAEVERYFTNALDLLCIADTTGRIRRLNPAWSQTLGYQLSELEGQLIADFVHPQDVTNTLKSLQQTEQSDHIASFVNRCRRTDGSYCYVEWRAILSDSLIYATARDVTKRYESEQRLRAGEARYRTLVDSLPDVVIHFDAEGRALYVSPTVKRISDIEADVLLGKTYLEAGFPKDQGTLWQARIQRVVKTGKPDEAEINVETKRRGTVVLDWRLIPLIGPDGVESVLSLARDVTDQKRLEREYQALFNEILSGVSIHEVIRNEHGIPLDHRLIAINPAFERMTGLREEEIQGRPLLDVLPNFDRQWLDLYGRVATTGTPAHFEAHFSDLQRHFEITAFRSGPNQVACIYTDITERRRLQEQSHQSAKLEAIGRLANGVAHDLNNLLMPILGYSEAALQDDVNRETSLEYLTEIRSAGLQAKDLVRQLLSFGKRQKVDFVVVNLNGVVSGFAKLLERALRENIRLELIQSPGPVWINADVGQLELILMNLAVNAQDSMPGGGTFTIEVGAPVARSSSAVEATSSPVEVQLTVRDDGPGLDPESLERVFEPFFTVKSTGRGTGLGLSAVHAIVEQHAGSIAVTSELGHGTEFVIRLPATQEPLASDMSSELPAPLSRARRGESILVVEDNPLVRDLAVRALEAQGYQVRSADGAKDCLSALVDWAVAFDLLLTDVVMPEMSGKALYEILSARSPRLKVLYMSGYSREFISEQHGIARDCAFLQKPFSIRRLLSTIEQQLDRVPPALV